MVVMAIGLLVRDRRVFGLSENWPGVPGVGGRGRVVDGGRFVGQSWCEW